MRLLATASVVLVAGSLISCSSMRRSEVERREARQFTIDNTWSRSTLKQEFLGFRRLNRMTAIATDQLILQANAIDGIVAYDRQTGGQIWRRNFVNGIEGGALVSAGKLYFGSSDGQFYCLNVADGKTVWSFQVRAETLAPPTIDGGVVYFQSGADVIYALDATTGKQLWLYNRQVTGNLSIRASTRPTVVGESLLAGFSDGFAVALKKRDGGLLWERRIGRGNRFKDVDATPVVDGPNAYISSFDGALISLKVETGEVNWTVDEGAYVPVTLGQGRWQDRLFYSTANGRILTVDKQSGQIVKSVQLTRGIPTQVAWLRDYLVYGESEGGFVVADPSGTEIGRFEPGLGVLAKPLVIEGSDEAYVISNSANLYKLKMGYTNPADKLPWQKVL